MTTHDVLTYSAKARKHKQVYPYLRYGFVVPEVEFVPRRFFIHNDALDYSQRCVRFFRRSREHQKTK
jgi:hypothetical protein